MARRILISIALGAIALLAPSCSKVSSYEQVRIEFAPMVATKSFVASEEDATFRTNGFSIFAWKANGNGETKKIFDATEGAAHPGAKVYYDEGKWKYSGNEYWSPMSTHYFMAVYPYKESGYSATFDSTTGDISVPVGTVSAGNGKLPDIMYSSCERFYQIGDPITPVALEFHHACAAMTIRVRNGSEFKINGISNITISKINRSGSLTLTSDGAIWSDAATGDPITLNYSGGTIESGSLEYKDILDSEMIIPQDFTSATGENEIVLKFTVDFESTDDKTYSIILSDISLPNGSAQDNYKFLPGKHYKYNLDITGSAIRFEVSIINWIEDDPIDLK